jgi:hypothetical protein
VQLIPAAIQAIIAISSGLQIGFSNVIRPNDGKTYILTPSQYNLTLVNLRILNYHKGLFVGVEKLVDTAVRTDNKVIVFCMDLTSWWDAPSFENNGNVQS